MNAGREPCATGTCAPSHSQFPSLDMPLSNQNPDLNPQPNTYLNPNLKPNPNPQLHPDLAGKEGHASAPAVATGGGGGAATAERSDAVAATDERKWGDLRAAAQAALRDAQALVPNVDAAKREAAAAAREADIANR